MVDEELQKCSPHHVLELEMRVIVREDKPIAQIMPEEKWHKLVTKRSRISWFEKIDMIVSNHKILRLVSRIGIMIAFGITATIIIQTII
jgi:hypothetical protein